MAPRVVNEGQGGHDIREEMARVARAWDVVVIGGGPAGSVAALSLARSGRAVLMVERTPMPRGKVCGCCVAAGAAARLGDMGLGHTLAGASVVDWCTVRVRGTNARLSLPEYRVLSREVFDTRLVEAAREAGVAVVMGWSGRVGLDGSVTLRPSDAGAESVVVQARVVVVADGLSGASVRDRPEFGWRVARASRMGVGATLERSPVALGDGEMAMLCGRFGYLGLVRLPTGEVNAAAALDPKALHDAGGPGALCASLVRSCGGDPESLEGAAWNGTPFLTKHRQRVEAGNVFVVGDAAGYVEPFTGEGMAWAIAGSSNVANVIEARLSGEAAPGAWTSAHAGLVRRAQRRCRVVASLMRHERCVQAVALLVARVPVFGSELARRLGPVSEGFAPLGEGRVA